MDFFENFFFMKFFKAAEDKQCKQCKTDEGKEWEAYDKHGNSSWFIFFLKNLVYFLVNKYFE